MSLPTIFKDVKQFYFKKGKRIYFVIFQLSEQNQQTYITYGTTILSNNPSPSNNLIQEHQKTAHNRYTKFPVIAPFNIPNQQSIQKSHITRNRFQKFINGTSFTKHLIRIFCQYGVRNRPSGKKFLRESEYLLSLSVLNKKLNQNRFKKESNLSKYKTTQPMQRIQLTTHQTNKISKTQPYYIVFYEQKRYIHVVYHRFQDGTTIYGACIFCPNNIKDFSKYDMNLHINTAFLRMTHYPVIVNIPSSMRYSTRSTDISQYDTRAIRKLRKSIGKYGVRDRSTVFTQRTPDFLSPHIINNKFHIYKKNIHREIASVKNNYSTWRQTTAKN